MNIKEKIQAIVFRKTKTSVEYLCLKRTPKNGGIWQPVTGNKDESDKSLLETCKREIKEEIGISNPVKIIENIYFFTFDTKKNGEPIEFEETVFGVEIEYDNEIRLQKEPYQEHNEYVWTSYDGAFELFNFISQKEALNKLHRILLKEITIRN